MGAIAPHTTPTTDTPWDGPHAVAECPNDPGQLRHMHAWVDSQGDPAAKSSYKFPHHAPGMHSPANLHGVRNALARLSGADIPDGDRAGVERHLQHHLDGGSHGDHGGSDHGTHGSGDHAMMGAPDRSERAVQARREAAQARAQHYRDGGITPGAVLRRESQVPAGLSRAVPFPTQMRGTTVERDGRQFYRVEGYATVWERPYPMWDVFGEYDEVIDRSALDASLAKGPDVAFLVNHRGVTMARTTNGTLELRADEHGLHTVAHLNAERADVQTLVSAINDGLISEMSFAFMLDEGTWNDDFSQFRIATADINRGDVSGVNYGANPYTNIAGRSQEFLRDLAHVPPGLAREALSRLENRSDVRQIRVADVLAATELPDNISSGRSVALILAKLGE